MHSLQEVTLACDAALHAHCLMQTENGDFESLGYWDSSQLIVMQETPSITNSMYGTQSSDAGADAASTFSSKTSAMTVQEMHWQYCFIAKADSACFLNCTWLRPRKL